jgi:hypothetical protein
MHTNNFPKLHNAAWPGVVGKGSPDGEPFIELDKMLDLTAAAEVDGVKFDGVDLFLFAPHVDIDSSDDDLKRLADKVASRGLAIGSVVAPVWGPTGGGSAFGSEADQTSSSNRCKLPHRSEASRSRHPQIRRGAYRHGRRKQVVGRSEKTQGRGDVPTADVAADFGDARRGRNLLGRHALLASMVQLLEMTDRPGLVGFQADMAHTLLYTLGYNAPEDRILPENWNWSDPRKLDEALATLTAALRPWTLDFHVAQNDATVKGSGSHDKTGKHCMATDPNGKLDIARHAGYWMRDGYGNVLKKYRHICWDGCMFPNEVMLKQQTWNDIRGR